MDVSSNNLEKARKLLSELSKLEDALDVLKNYDAQIYAEFWTAHNNNRKGLKTVQITLPESICSSIKEHISDRIFKIKEELKKL